MSRMWMPKEGKNFTVETLIHVLQKYPKNRHIICACDEEWNAIGQLAIDVPNDESQPITFFPVNTEPT